MTGSPSVRPPAVAKVHIVMSHRGAAGAIAEEQVITQPRSETAYDLADHEGPSALRKPILFPLTLSGLSFAQRKPSKMGGERGREQGKEDNLFHKTDVVPHHECICSFSFF